MLCDRCSDFPPMHRKPTKYFKGGVLAFYRIAPCLTKFNILHKKPIWLQAKTQSTAMAILDFLEKIYSAIDNSEYSTGIFLDLAKAFDTVNHTILLNKSEHF